METKIVFHIEHKEAGVHTVNINVLLEREFLKNVQEMQAKSKFMGEYLYQDWGHGRYLDNNGGSYCYMEKQLDLKQYKIADWIEAVCKEFEETIKEIRQLKKDFPKIESYRIEKKFEF